MPSPIRQQALTVALPVRSERALALDAWLEHHADDVRARLGRVGSLHFGRFVLLPGSTPSAASPRATKALLAFESNFDGDLAEHLAELWREAGAVLEPMLAHCEAWPLRTDLEVFARYVRRHVREASAFFVAHPGLSVARVRADAKARFALGQVFDRLRGELIGKAPRELVARARDALREAAVGSEIELIPVDRGISVRRRGPLQVLFAHAPALLLTVVLAFLYDAAELVRGLWHDTKGSAVDAARLARVGLEEAGRLENGLTHVVELKPGSFRRAALRLALRVTDELAESASLSGKLGGIDSIHFARWVLLDDGRLVFFSNYDGSWEAYLGDFIEQASRALTMIWSNTLGFPATLGWIFGGARDEAGFKRWTRAHQLPTPIWYSAYPELTVSEVLKNAEIREILARELDDAGARRVLELMCD